MEPQYLSHTLWLRLGGNKFPIARDPDLFQLLPPKPKGPALKKCGRVGTRNTLTIGSEKRGGLNSLIFYFKFCLFAKYGFFWFCFCLVREMVLEGNASLTPLLHVLHGACPQAPANPSISQHQVLGVVPGLCRQHRAAAERDSGAAMTGTAWRPFPGQGQPHPESAAHQLLTHTLPLFALLFWGPWTTVVSLPPTPFN